MIADLIMFLFYFLLFSVFMVLPCYLFEWLIDRAEKKEQRRVERKQRQQERREFRSKVFESEMAVALNRADCALRGIK